MIIGLTGPKLAGKGTVAAYLGRTAGAKAFSMSGILTDLASRLHLPNSRENLIAIATGLRSQFGEAILAQVLAKDLVQADPALAIIDGIRMPSEVDAFASLPDFQMIYIDAPVALRYERARSRGEKAGESDQTFAQFQAEEQAVTETGIAALRQRASAIIDNHGTLDELYQQVDSVLSPSK
jgi:dephospho-CoA kinase